MPQPPDQGLDANDHPERLGVYEAATEEALDLLEYTRFVELFHWVPFDCVRPAGAGRG